MVASVLGSCETTCFNSCSALVDVEFEPVGRWFEACLKRQRSEHSVSVTEESKIHDTDLLELNEEISEDDKVFLLSLEPSEWKKQDHYRVLNISHLRSRASDEDIKNAYRRMVLKHHPDKKKPGSPVFLPGLNEHAYFTCITRAYEVLSTVAGRRAFDSVDEAFDDSIPTFSSTSKQDFFEVFAPVFDANARWSVKQPVPQLGDASTSIDDVNRFYSFWYDDFNSWREFSYMDDDTGKAESREERRWMERQNRQMRQKRKKEEILRIRSLVDTAYSADPRIKSYLEEKRLKKAEEKRLKEELAKQKEKERLQALEEQKRQQEKADQEARDKAMKEKKEREKQKKLLSRDRKIIREFVKDQNFFLHAGEQDASALDRLEKALEYLSADRIQELKELSALEALQKFRALYTQYSEEILQELQRKQDEKQKAMESSQAKSGKANVGSVSCADQNWSDLEVQLLVKATTIYPVGTASRWDVIADYINEHSDSGKKKTGKHVISKVKKLQKLDPSIKEEVNRKAFQSLAEATSARLVKVDAPITCKDAGSAPASLEVVEKPWTSEEQRLLEQALKQYDSNCADRWDKIAAVVSTRSKKDCMRRYKELVDMVKAKKAASGSQANLGKPR